MQDWTPSLKERPTVSVLTSVRRSSRCPEKTRCRSMLASRGHSTGRSSVSPLSWNLMPTRYSCCAKRHKVSVSLGEVDYARAITAHQEFLDVEVVGSLIQRGTRTYLSDARGFSVRPPV